MAFCKSKPVQEFVDPLLEIPSTQTIQMTLMPEILNHSEFAIQTLRLKHHACRTPDQMSGPQKIFAKHAQAAGAGQQKRSQNAEE
jgi:hypothetical protein